MSILLTLQSSRPKAIDPLRVEAFLWNAQQVLNQPELAHLLSKYADSNEAIKRAVKPLVKKRKKAIYADDEGEDDDMEKLKAFKPCCVPYVSDGVGVFTIDGVIGKGMSPLERMLGCVDIDEITQTLDLWAERPDVNEIVFKFDSGGGTTTGLQELAKKIRNYNKPTIAWCETQCNSAAYWLASQCTRLVVTPSAELGAVGIYLTICDESQKFADEGKQVVVIKSGEYKAAGVSGTSLSDNQKANLQEECVELHRRFIADIKAVRIFANEADLQGQTFYGDIAVQKGLATANKDSFKELMEEIKAFRNSVATTVMNSAYAVSR